MQENSRKPDGSRLIPTFDRLVTQSESCLDDNLWHGMILNIGLEGGHPILTLTTAQTDLADANAPSEEYVKMIASGTKETYPQMSDVDIVNYLLQADGVRRLIDPTIIQDWVANAP